MRVTNVSQLGYKNLSGILDGSVRTKQTTDNSAAMAQTKSLGDNFQNLSQAAEKLKKPGNFKDAAAYAAALQSFTQAYNQTTQAAKAIGGIEGRQVKLSLDRVSSQLAAGAKDSGFAVKQDGSLEVDAAKAKAAFTASGTTATSAFSGVADRLTLANAPIQQSVDTRVKHYQAAIDKATREQVMVNVASQKLSMTYGAQGQLSQYMGPSSIYNLL